MRCIAKGKKVIMHAFRIAFDIFIIRVEASTFIAVESLGRHLEMREPFTYSSSQLAAVLLGLPDTFYQSRHLIQWRETLEKKRGAKILSLRALSSDMKNYWAS